MDTQTLVGIYTLLRLLIYCGPKKNHFLFFFFGFSFPLSSSYCLPLTRYGLDGPGIESRWGRDFTYLSRPALGPTQPPIQWVPSLSRG